MSKIMAVMNLTPDSFSDGGQVRLSESAVLSRAELLIEQGADWLDLGGESTRPGAEPVSSEEEIQRVIPALGWIKRQLNVPVSVDTSNPELMKQALNLGADMINDVRALTRPGALQACAQTDVPVVLMHMQGTPQTMQSAPDYGSVVDQVTEFLNSRVDACMQAGINAERVWIDPGFGFGKTLKHNQQLFKALPILCAGKHPVLVGVSRKTMIGDLTGQPVENRAVGSAVAAALAVKSGAAMVRVHDVEQTRDAIAVIKGLTDE